MDSDDPLSTLVTVEAPGWRLAVADPEGLCRRAARSTLALAGAPPAVPLELGILLTDDAAVRELNRTWRGRDAATNVLSFPTGDGAVVAGAPRLLGDVVVALETIGREAAGAGRSCADHLAHMVVHGVLHLLGHDHDSDEEARRMEALERRILGTLGVADPYAEEAA